MPAISARAASFTESVIREMTRLAVDARRRQPGPGLPDFARPTRSSRPPPALHDDINQYAITWGAQAAARAIAGEDRRVLRLDVDPETADDRHLRRDRGDDGRDARGRRPGDEVVVFEPFYENYGPDAMLSGATPRFVTLHEPDWSIDPDELRAAFTRGPGRSSSTRRTTPPARSSRAPSWSSSPASARSSTPSLTDEIYEHIVYEGEHIPMATLPGMADRTITINWLSKTYSVTGWRLGWVIAPPELSQRRSARSTTS